MLFSERLLSSYPSTASCRSDSLRSAANLQLAEDTARMAFHGRFADEELAANLFVTAAASYSF